MFFSDQERLIYQCPSNRLFYDPLVLKRVVTAECRGEYNALVGKAAAGDSTAQGALIAAARKAFGLPGIDPQSGSGYTDARVYETLTDFTRWLRGKGPRVQTPPNSVPSTESRGNHSPTVSGSP